MVSGPELYQSSTVGSRNKLPTSVQGVPGDAMMQTVVRTESTNGEMK